MTQARKDQLYNQMFAWICEELKGSDEDLFYVLHHYFGMTKEELHEHGVRNLDAFFPENDPKALLKQKIVANYEEFKAKWLSMESNDLIKQCGKIEGVTRMMQMLPSSVSDKDAEYLLRFKNPLEVVSDKWISRNGMDSLVADDEMSHLLWALQDCGDAEQIYEMEPETSDEDETPALSM